MKLIYPAVREGVRACTMALQIAGMRFSKSMQSVPLVQLQLDERDWSGNLIHIIGELSICRFALQQYHPANEGDLELSEWLIYSLKKQVQSEQNVKTNQQLSDHLAYLNSLVQGKYIYGENPNTSDLLAFCYLQPLFKKNTWLLKRYVNLKNLLGNFTSEYDNAQIYLGEKSKAVYQQVQDYQKEVKLERIRRDPVLPQAGRRNILVTSALPYVNNVPHLGNIIGCVLSADVYARYCRLRGHNVVYVCGTDEYGTATETKALKEGLTPKEICDKFFVIHRDIYEWFNIDFEIFGRTTTDHQTVITQDIFKKLQENHFTFEDDVQQTFCESCNRFLADRYVLGTCPKTDCGSQARGDQCDKCGSLLNPTELIDPKCLICNSTPVERQSHHIFLNLPAIKDNLEAWIEQSSKLGGWSNNCQKITQTWIRDGLRPRCITRDLKWGTPIPVPGFEEKVFYVWFDAPIGYLSITANYTDQWQQWWKNPDNVELVQFMGKDNVPFHTVIFPCSLIGTNENYTLIHRISTTEYLNYEGGKFSKTDGVGIFGDGAIESGINAEVYRFYLLANRPEVSDTVFSWDDLATKNNNQLLANVGNLCNRVLKFLEKQGSVIPALGQLETQETELLSEVYQLIRNYDEELEQIRIKQALMTCLEYCSSLNKYLQEVKLWELAKTNATKTNTILNLTANLLRVAGCLFEPFIPQFSAKLYSQLNLNRTQEDETLLKTIVESNDPNILLQNLKEGHKIGTIAPIFKKITDEEVVRLRERYGGKQN